MTQSSRRQSDTVTNRISKAKGSRRRTSLQWEWIQRRAPSPGPRRCKGTKGGTGDEAQNEGIPNWPFTALLMVGGWSPLQHDVNVVQAILKRRLVPSGLVHRFVHTCRDGMKGSNMYDIQTGSEMDRATERRWGYSMHAGSNPRTGSRKCRHLLFRLRLSKPPRPRKRGAGQANIKREQKPGASYWE
jgi:hypothetical protein